MLKDGGDDLDCTHGTPVVAEVRLTAGEGLSLKAGKGVGIVTKPGLQVPVGRPAINPGPQLMMRLEVTISIPHGEELAKQTLNPAMGVVGGISVLGTTGIVKPMSEDAYKRSLAPQISVIRACGWKTAVLTPGRIGVTAAQRMGIPRDVIAETSNFIGYMLEQAVAAGFRKILLIGHMGKLVKVASGSVVREILNCTTTDAAAEVIRRERLEAIYPQLAERAQERCERYIFGRAEVGVIFAAMDGTVVAASSRAVKLAEEEQWNIV